MSDHEAERHNVKIRNSISSISKYTTRDNIDWILQRIGGVNSKILPTEYLKVHDPSLIGGTALHMAYSLDEFKVFKILLEHGADFTTKNQQEKTVIHLILGEECKDCLQWEGDKIKYADLILTHHVKSNIISNPCDSNGMSHFHVACMSSNVEAVKFFLSNGIPVDQPVNMDSPILPGYTPLHFATRFQNLELIQILLDHNADKNLKDAKGMTALHFAFQGSEGDLRKRVPEITSAKFYLISLLLYNQRNYILNPIDPNGLSHFHIACCMNNPVVVEEFLKHGVDANQSVNFVFGAEDASSSPYHLAVKNMFSEFVDLSDQVKTILILIKYGASLLAEDACCNTPLHVCAKLESPDASLFKILIEGGADVNARNLEGQTPLEILMSKRIVPHGYLLDGQIDQLRDENAIQMEIERRFDMQRSHKALISELVPIFVEKGYHFNSFNPIDEKGGLALLEYWCGDRFVQDIASKIVNDKFSNLLVDELGRGILHNVSAIPPEEQIHFQDLNAEPNDGCLRLDWDVDGRDKLGRTALHMAAQFHNWQATVVLLLLGADVNVVDAQGLTAIEYAFRTCSLCNLLLNVGEYDEDEEHKHDVDEHVVTLGFYVEHLEKLQYCGLDVSQRNRDLAIKIRERFRDQIFEVDELFYAEVDDPKTLTMGPFSFSLGDFLSETRVVAEYPFMMEPKRYAIDDYFRSKTVYKQFSKTAELLRLQYRKAVKRMPIVRKASVSLSTLIGFEMPYLCARIIFSFLSNSELKNLSQAANTDESTMSD